MAAAIPQQLCSTLVILQPQPQATRNVIVPTVPTHHQPQPQTHPHPHPHPHPPSYNLRQHSQHQDPAAALAIPVGSTDPIPQTARPGYGALLCTRPSDPASPVPSTSSPHASSYAATISAVSPQDDSYPPLSAFAIMTQSTRRENPVDCLESAESPGKSQKTNISHFYLPPTKRRRVSNLNSVGESSRDHRPAVPGLPDDILVRVLRFVACAPTLAMLRQVSKSWRQVIDTSPALWTHASFKRTSFCRPVMIDTVSKCSHRDPQRTGRKDYSDHHDDNERLSLDGSSSSCASSLEQCRMQFLPAASLSIPRTSITDVETGRNAIPSSNWRTTHIDASPVCTSPVQKQYTGVYPLCTTTPRPARSPTRLTLGPRPGYRTVRLAAAAGNEWALFLLETLFNHRTLYAMTVHAPLASHLVHGKVARMTPPPSIRQSLSTSLFCPNFLDQWNATLPVSQPPGWVVVHSARGRGHGGALVGLLHTVDNPSTNSSHWTINRAVALRRPIYCAGFVGLWPMTPYLTELLIHAIHAQ